ncbi:adenosylcobinamide-GDP ribazoletransferase [Pararhodobacter oceanensis]|uniref:adenosylcobinamide-GDP ribazoletransferase n=1 Tax=Pararhodobacter oceanensis TaxID=2172121 RepID=UPI003A918BDA
MRRLAEFRLALMMLTRLPAGHIAAPPSIGASAWAFPLVGGIVGALSALVLLVALWLGIAPVISAGLALVAMVLVTGGLHEDGLADLVDGFGGGQNVARKLEIMRDSQIGSYGTLVLILSLGLRWTALHVVLMHAGAWGAATALIAIAVASRSGLAAALTLMPAARGDGMGRAASGASLPQAAIATALGVAALLITFGPSGLILAALIAAAQIGLARLAIRQIGGQTGDVLGALQQIAEVTGWVALTALI